MARKFNFTGNETAQVQKKEISNISNVKEQEKPKKEITSAGTLVEKLENEIPKAWDPRFIPRNKLEFYTENDYPQEEIESLANKILHFGLINNLEVLYNLETDKYIIDSGERRCRAIDFLIQTYKDTTESESKDYKDYFRNVKQFETGYPCNVKQTIEKKENLIAGENNSQLDGLSKVDQIEMRIRHFVANEEVRKNKDPQKTAQRINELNSLYTLRNQLIDNAEVSIEDEKITNINKKIAEDLGISDRQVKKYKATEKLIPELQKLFKKREINLTDGSNYAQLREEEQKQILELIENGGDKKTIDELYNNITTLKKDIAEKENAIETLEAEKKDALKEIGEAQKTISKLENQLKNESEKESPDKKNLAELEKQLADANKGVESQKEIHNKVISEKDQQIDYLKKQLEKREIASNTIPSGYQESLKVKMDITSIKKSLQDMLENIEAYSSLYREEEPVGISPYLYKKEIRIILEQALRRIT